MGVDTSADSSLDEILTEVGGFGLFQIVTFVMICIPNIISSATYVNFMISATTLDYRCKVPECDIGENNREIQFDQPWLRSAIPFSENKPDNCFRYAPKNFTTFAPGQCTSEMFDRSFKIPCEEFIYATDERNVQTEFNIHCSDSYKLALVGTLNSAGRFVFLPLTGFLSDRFGRLTVVITGIWLCSIIGIIKSFAVNYYMYIAMEFFESAAGTATYGGMFVLAIELVSSRYRVLSSTLISLSHPIGEIIFGFIAMLVVHDFRILLRVSYIPGLFFLVYFFFAPESIRWLLITGRVDRALKILKRIARVNKKELSAKSIELIRTKYTIDAKTKSERTSKEEASNEQSLFQSFCLIFKSKTLCIRFFTCCYQWVTCCFNYYGISLLATHIPGADLYVSFITVVAIEIPSILISLPLFNRMKRRVLLFSSLTVTAISITATSFIAKEHSTAILLVSMLGKASMTFSFGLLYIFTAEQWPTKLRTTIMNSCSMIGRIGSMIAPFVVILGSQHGSLPAFLFGGSAMIAAILVVFNPETFGKKLPDTIEEARDL